MPRGDRKESSRKLGRRARAPAVSQDSSGRPGSFPASRPGEPASMKVPAKTGWRITASGGDPTFAADDRYATAWTSAVGKAPSIEIDFGGAAKLGGLEV